MRLFAALLALPCAASVLACDTGPLDPGAVASTGPASPDTGPPLPEVTLAGTTQPSAAPGLCTAWSSTVLDLSALAGTYPRALVHGVEGGFSVVAASRDPRVAALAFDAAGAPRGPEIDLPLQTGTVTDVLATSEGGWL
ncbi:MAG TPA: hypothetical protein VHS09_00435, partial [Polyangiaceae bacterium]|nr:hypothetical protein [Polyangiaceae bacterium]